MTGLVRAAIAGLLFAATTCAREYGKTSSGEWRPGTSEHTLTVAGDDRTFLLQVPAARPRNRFGAAAAYPLVILLHGSGADGEMVRTQSGIEAAAEARRFVVAYPNGSTRLLGFGSDWNAGDCCGAAARNNVDDVAFIRAVIADVSSHVPIDRRRIYVAGFSDGARMAYRLACDAAPQIAAIGVVSGSLERERCAPSRPVAVVAFHGTDDQEVAYDAPAKSTAARAATAASAGLPPAVRFWSVMDGCSGVAVARLSPHVTRAAFAPCAGADVALYTIDGGMHAWPGGQRDGPDGAQPTTELRATDVMVDFFYRHRIR